MDHVLTFEQIIFASPVYWYSVAPPMKIFLDRFSDLLDLPDLMEQGRRLREKTGYVIFTSNCDEVPAPFLGAFQETFSYLGMQYAGCAHANCIDGFIPAQHEGDVVSFINRVRA